MYPIRCFIASSLDEKRIRPEILFSWNTSENTPTNRFNENIGKHVLLLFHFSQNRITIRDSINPFHATGSLLYSTEISENLQAFWCFQGVQKEISCRKWPMQKSSIISVYWSQLLLTLWKKSIFYNAYWL